MDVAVLQNISHRCQCDDRKCFNESHRVTHKKSHQSFIILMPPIRREKHESPAVLVSNPMHTVAAHGTFGIIVHTQRTDFEDTGRRMRSYLFCPPVAFHPLVSAFLTATSTWAVCTLHLSNLASVPSLYDPETASVLLFPLLKWQTSSASCEFDLSPLTPGSSASPQCKTTASENNKTDFQCCKDSGYQMSNKARNKVLSHLSARAKSLLADLEFLFSLVTG